MKKNFLSIILMLGLMLASFMGTSSCNNKDKSKKDAKVENSQDQNQNNKSSENN